MSKYQSIVQRTSSTFGLDAETAALLVNRIDLLKLQGFTGGQALSQFGDYLGFLRIPDNEQSLEFFAQRWADPLVWSPITKENVRYLNPETPLFTQSRLEPHFMSSPFFKQGLTKVGTGVSYNPEDSSALRKAPGLTEDYSNFVVSAFLPPAFFVEVKNSEVQAVLEHGIEATHEGNDSSPEDEHVLYLTPEDARANLAVDLRRQQLPVSRATLLEHTLLEIATDSMTIDNRVFYTKTVSGHKGQGSNYGYFYSGSVPPGGVTVSKLNLTE